jgi:hypothetical protein
MSRESQEIFSQTVADYPATGDDSALRAAAVGHLGASRSLAELTAMYAQALEAGNTRGAQQLADELAPVRAAERVLAGIVPRSG